MYIFKNANIVTTNSIYKGDVLVRNGKISQIGEQIDNKDAVYIDVSNKYLLPGGIDVHTHISLPLNNVVSTDDFFAGTKAAAFGGITTIVDFAIQNKNMTLDETLRRKLDEAAGKAVVDYGITVAITDFSESVLEEIPNIVENGCPTFKVFMTYDFAVDDYTLFNVLEKVKNSGGMLEVHAENKNIIENNIKKLLKEGKTGPMYHYVSREDYVEAEAINRAAILAEETKAPIYIVHLSSNKGLLQIKQSRGRGGEIICETCPQYLILTKEKYKEGQFEGAKYVMSPPLRSIEDNENLWMGIKNGDIQIVASDHCPFTLEEKKLGIDRFDKIPNGAPGVETSMMILYSEGVLKNKISLNKIVEVLSYNPAKFFGFENKGAIEIGKDADLVVFDPDKKKVLSYKNLHSLNDYSTYEGLEIRGVPVMTMCRGKIVFEDDKFVGEKGYGKFIKRKLKQKESSSQTI